ncbi:MAG: S-methyl-5-thioribose-1-phosphate isomerase [Gammaproteobacteria bacterium]|nr:S-methyl-5-thioribose-1-phosphate isomerase [Gammaproteobacteria bacterium]
METIQPILWENGVLKLLDQRILPHSEDYISYQNCRDVADAITDMVVRGAPAIGITAAYGVALAVKKYTDVDVNRWQELIEDDLIYLSKARPTAINLNWAIDEMRKLFSQCNVLNPLPEVQALAIKIHQDDIDNNRIMGKLGADLIRESITGEIKPAVITHCNAGALATGGYGTALGVIRSAWEQGLISHVYADETRPWLQGARLTAWEMVKEEIPVSLLVDGAASHVIKTSQQTDAPIGWIIVGSDRIAANGDVANKIGTYGLAVNAKYHGLKVMVVAPTSTIDFKVASGNDIPIEERSNQEVLNFAGSKQSAKGALARNPAFDVTPAELVDAIVTEKGVVLKPTTDKMLNLK